MGLHFRLSHVVCPSTPNDNRHQLHIFSEEWHSTGRSDKVIPEKPPSFLLRFVGKESGTAVLNWMEISRARTSLRLQVESTKNSSRTSSAYNGLPIPSIDCPFHCPELNACINASLWCDGNKNCPSGFDELESHCDLKFKVLRNYVILCSILAVIFVLTVFVLVATIRRSRFSGVHYVDDMTPRRVTTEETLYEQSSSTISS